MLTAPAPVGEPTTANYEVVVDADATVILTGDVETFYTVPGQLQLQLNRDPEIQKMKQREQLKSLKKEQQDMQRARQLQTGK